MSRAEQAEQAEQSRGLTFVRSRYNQFKRVDLILKQFRNCDGLNAPFLLADYVNSSQPSSKLKSNGTDDGFKGEAAKCGSSVIKVAHQMVSSQVARGFGQTEDFPPKGFDPSKRRGSRSLPNSPLVSPNTSPKGKRKLANKYFTGPFTDTDKYQGSWILSNLLGKREALSRSVGVIAEEEVREEVGRGVSEISLDDPQSRTMGSAKNIYRAKPSELREMNFWSPTSM